MTSKESRKRKISEGSNTNSRLERLTNLYKNSKKAWNRYVDLNRTICSLNSINSLTNFLDLPNDAVKWLNDKLNDPSEDQPTIMFLQENESGDYFARLTLGDGYTITIETSRETPTLPSSMGPWTLLKPFLDACDIEFAIDTNTGVSIVDILKVTKVLRTTRLWKEVRFKNRYKDDCALIGFYEEVAALFKVRNFSNVTWNTLLTKYGLPPQFILFVLLIERQGIAIKSNEGTDNWTCNCVSHFDSSQEKWLFPCLNIDNSCEEESDCDDESN